MCSHRCRIAFELAVIARVALVAFALQRVGVVVSVSAAELATVSTQRSRLRSLTGSARCDVTVVHEDFVPVRVGECSDASS